MGFAVQDGVRAGVDHLGDDLEVLQRYRPSPTGVRPTSQRADVFIVYIPLAPSIQRSRTPLLARYVPER